MSKLTKQNLELDPNNSDAVTANDIPYAIGETTQEAIDSKADKDSPMLINGATITAGATNTAFVELKCDTGQTPYIDMTAENGVDYDTRLITEPTPYPPRTGVGQGLFVISAGALAMRDPSGTTHYTDIVLQRGGDMSKGYSKTYSGWVEQWITINVKSAADGAYNGIAGVGTIGVKNLIPGGSANDSNAFDLIYPIDNAGYSIETNWSDTTDSQNAGVIAWAGNVVIGAQSRLIVYLGAVGNVQNIEGLLSIRIRHKEGRVY